MKKVSIIRQQRGEYHKLIVDRPGETRMAEVHNNGEFVEVFGNFSANDVAALVQAAYNLGREVGQ